MVVDRLGDIRPVRRDVLVALGESAAPGSERYVDARDLCEALDLGLLPENIEGLAFKLMRLVVRGILTEPGTRIVQPDPAVGSNDRGADIAASLTSKKPMAPLGPLPM